MQQPSKQPPNVLAEGSCSRWFSPSTSRAVGFKEYEEQRRSIGLLVLESSVFAGGD